LSSQVSASQVFKRALAEHLGVIESLSAQQGVLERIAGEMTAALLSGKKVLWCGNGGSAADCQHMAAELMGRFRRERRGLPSIALTTDTSILTAIGNDYGYERVFERQVEALCLPGDVVVGISTSGSSRNVCTALDTAKKIGAFTVAFTRRDGAMSKIVDAAVCIDSNDTARIQEAHILCGHMICDWVELSVCEQEAAEKSAFAK
jgi:D-sedoheptulose 7-phosphate isomerase